MIVGKIEIHGGFVHIANVSKGIVVCLTGKFWHNLVGFLLVMAHEMGTRASRHFEVRIFYTQLSLDTESAMSDTIPIISEAKKP